MSVESAPWTDEELADDFEAAVLGLEPGEYARRTAESAKRDAYKNWRPFKIKLKNEGKEYAPMLPEEIDKLNRRK